jgi:hypothetical protein
MVSTQGSANSIKKVDEGLRTPNYSGCPIEL